MTKTTANGVPGTHRCPHSDCADKDRRFTRKGDVDRHMLHQHNPNYQPFTCPYCQVSNTFKQKTGLRTHHRKNHPNIPWETTEIGSKSLGRITKAVSASKKWKARKESERVPSTSTSPYPGQSEFLVNINAHPEADIAPLWNDSHLSPGGFAPFLQQPAVATEAPDGRITATPFYVPRVQRFRGPSFFSAPAITINGKLPQKSLFPSAPDTTPYAPRPGVNLLGPPARIMPSLGNTSTSRIDASGPAFPPFGSPIQPLGSTSGLTWPSHHGPSSASTPNDNSADELSALWDHRSTPGSASYTPTLSTSSLGPSTPITPDIFLYNASSPANLTFTPISMDDNRGLSSQSQPSLSSSSNILEQTARTEMRHMTFGKALKRPATAESNTRKRPYPSPRSQQQPMSYAEVVARGMREAGIAVTTQQSIQKPQPIPGQSTKELPPGLLFQPSPNVMAHSNMRASTSFPVSYSHSPVATSPSVPPPTRFAQGACMNPQGQVIQQETAYSWYSESAPSTVVSRQPHMPSYVPTSVTNSTNPTLSGAVRMPRATADIWPPMGPDHNTLWGTQYVSGGQPMINMPVNTPSMNTTAPTAQPRTTQANTTAPVLSTGVGSFATDPQFFSSNKGFMADESMNLVDNRFSDRGFHAAVHTPPAAAPIHFGNTPFSLSEAPQYTMTSLPFNGSSQYRPGPTGVPPVRPRNHPQIR
ncbi:hypothetical protein D9619_013602 [Psilocybe cf. subviscida]|uniref:C2H2-type domain-containing protein n=1 Tax=Psilocybe cf. subviscida TaxID=2480587 RepID=A0A8H5AQY5_9AGAR|nr:hypothetical protein D9619_013602 [Psilocybe cf. subviscida]